MTILQEIFISNSQKIWSQKRQYILQGLGRGLNTQSELIILKCSCWRQGELITPTGCYKKCLYQMIKSVKAFYSTAYRYISIWYIPIGMSLWSPVLSFHAMNPVLDILDVFHISISMLIKWAVLKMMTN